MNNLFNWLDALASDPYWIAALMVMLLVLIVRAKSGERRA